MPSTGRKALMIGGGGCPVAVALLLFLTEEAVSLRLRWHLQRSRKFPHHQSSLLDPLARKRPTLRPIRSSPRPRPSLRSRQSKRFVEEAVPTEEEDTQLIVAVDSSTGGRDRNGSLKRRPRRGRNHGNRERACL